MKKSSIICVFFAATFVFTGSLLAFPGYDSTWQGVYPNSNSAASSCQLCHQSPGGQGFNPYGTAMINAGGTLADRIVAIQNDDSDGDPGGFTNLEEINAHTQPGWTVGDADAPAVELDPTPPPVENCTDGVDNDGDGMADCDDQDCQNDIACQLPETETVCDDGRDDDGDGFVDCADTDCTNDPVCAPQPVAEICDDGLDNDLDGATDCDDADCVNDSACAPQPVVEICDDSIDNDLDGATDCDDTDCTNDTACAQQPEAEVCDDGLDNDGDGFTDCDDQECAADPVCDQTPVFEDCADGVDNDGDGFIDCTDTDCASDPSCQVVSPQPLEDDISVDIKVEGAKRGNFEVEFEFEDRVAIETLICGLEGEVLVPPVSTEVEFEHNETEVEVYVKTAKDQCGNTTRIVCRGTLSDGRSFMGTSDKLRTGCYDDDDDGDDRNHRYYGDDDDKKDDRDQRYNRKRRYDREEDDGEDRKHRYDRDDDDDDD